MRFDKYRPRESGVASVTAGPKVAYFDRVDTDWGTVIRRRASEAPPATVQNRSLVDTLTGLPRFWNVWRC